MWYNDIMDKKTIILVALAIIVILNIASFALMGRDKRCARHGKWRVPEKTLFFGDGVLWRTGRRAGYEGVPSQDPALVFQSVLSGVADHADCLVDDWCIPTDVMIQTIKSEFIGIKKRTAMPYEA